MVPSAPFPDDFRAAILVWSDFNHLVAPQFPLREVGWISAGVDGTKAVNALPTNGQNVSIGQDFDVMMQPSGGIVQ